MHKRFSQVVLVDDDAISNFIAKEVIESSSLADEVIALQDAGMAIEYFRNNSSFSTLDTTDNLLMFLDLNMPGMDGFEFLDEFSKLDLKIDVKVILLTGSVHKRDLEQAKAYNLLGYLSKPLTQDKIESLMQESH